MKCQKILLTIDRINGIISNIQYPISNIQYPISIHLLKHIYSQFIFS
ncbi:hypothetical protein P0082_09425 [Candidatus Haliotispira prima]|uniref:Uncharacterized protein n=1 Tax=Candidatus Haliotispira prima TaxID=3034016 RepID=A0ABY8MFQ2_9SPIO|nr:hypothetical protein P0082_09425 [Candidatus Haliotispira prima]